MTSLAVIIGFIVGGIVLMLAELVLPGMVAGFVGAMLLIGGIVLGFMRDPGLGIGLLIGTIVVGLFAFWLWVKLFPSSRIGKKMFLDHTAKEWHGFDATRAQLLGQHGIAHTILRPSGTARFGDDRYDVVTQGEIVEAGSPVEVVRVEGNRIVVTQVTADHPSSDQPAAAS